MFLLLLLGAGYVGSRACEPCHAAILRQYSRTPMARSSGLAGPEIPQGSVTHTPSSMTYRIASLGGIPQFQYASAAALRKAGTARICRLGVDWAVVPVPDRRLVVPRAGILLLAARRVGHLARL